MGWCADNHIPAVNDYARKVYGKDVFSNHFIMRVYQRFTPEERLCIFAELRDLIKGGMYQHLFPTGKSEVNVILQNKIKVCLSIRSSGKMVVKTAFIPTKTALSKLVLQ